MKTLLVYASKSGCTEKCAALVAGKLQGEVTSIDLGKNPSPSLTAFDAVVIGTFIRVGQGAKPVKEFMVQNMDALLQKKVALFLCCANEEAVETQMKAAFPEPLYSHAVAREHLGFGFYFDKMNFIERKMISIIAKTKENKEAIHADNIERLAAALRDG